MPADIINLRKARKDKLRAERQKQAQENRVEFGRAKAERQKTAKVRDIECARLDGKRLPKLDDDGVDPESVS